MLLTGLPAAGKTTLAYALERRLFDAGRAVTVLDGGRCGTAISQRPRLLACGPLENLRRAAEVAKLDQRRRPHRALRLRRSRCRRSAPRPARWSATNASSWSTSRRRSTVCRRRDTRGVYARAEAGELGDFPGVSAPYEPPEDADLVIDTSTESIEASVEKVIALLARREGPR